MPTPGKKVAKRFSKICKRSAPSATLASQIFFQHEGEFPFYTLVMRNEFTAVIERDGE
jgi:hypothetical protein